MTTTPEQMQRILETLFPRSKYATQPAPVETKVEVKIDDTDKEEKKEIKTIQDAFDQLFTELDEIRAEIEQFKIYANKQTEVINDNAKQFLVYKQAHDAAAQIMFADSPELKRRVTESVEIYRKRLEEETKENTK